MGLFKLYSIAIILSLFDAIYGKEKIKFDTKLFLDICISKPKLKSKRDEKALQWLLENSGKRSIQSNISNQHKAACWMLHDDPKKLSAGNHHFSQRYALAVLYFATQGDTKWKVKTNWLSGTAECDWYGVECVLGKVNGLDLGFNDLFGLLPRELSLLQKLEEVDLHGNDLQGVVPHSVLAAWKNCKILRLHMNGFFGALPTEIGLMTSLEELYLFGNYFEGAVPAEVANLKKLKILDLYANAFGGNVPSQIGSLQNLKELDLHDNNFRGRVPRQICERKLSFLAADCLDGSLKEVECDCCTICCEGMPNMRCFDQNTKQEVIVGQRQ
mmetsp:Transcript_22115/g.33425  ORF Transcript_22115/g.33425 Transcript_22115/m.33425 type:complete len:328 (-) Transcript_22115:119-1102(-)|eukprot:CAMPEP_0178908008 /NCGR_PEP_ID=MMETSP0786-20121207/7685_1 /TAXON_ID=186022 /ORGANISM="Thalassionema frauenfeldii, Strain CCMP 1798" /LENGTH=327 /DNA_ID=CAMNT_0020579865 /DNA_START=541 /DNA_END=1524 /DNA_ORIENTATION=-